MRRILAHYMLLSSCASVVHLAPVSRDGHPSTVLMEDSERDRIRAAGGNLNLYGTQSSPEPHETSDPRKMPRGAEAEMPFNQRLFDMAFPEDELHEKELLEPFSDDIEDDKVLEAEYSDEKYPPIEGFDQPSELDINRGIAVEHHGDSPRTEAGLSARGIREDSTQTNVQVRQSISSIQDISARSEFGETEMAEHLTSQATPEMSGFQDEYDASVHMLSNFGISPDKIQFLKDAKEIIRQDDINADVAFEEEGDHDAGKPGIVLAQGSRRSSSEDDDTMKEILRKPLDWKKADSEVGFHLPIENLHEVWSDIESRPAYQPPEADLDKPHPLPKGIRNAPHPPSTASGSPDAPWDPIVYGSVLSPEKRGYTGKRAVSSAHRVQSKTPGRDMPHSAQESAADYREDSYGWAPSRRHTDSEEVQASRNSALVQTDHQYDREESPDSNYDDVIQDSRIDGQRKGKSRPQQPKSVLEGLIPKEISREELEEQIRLQVINGAKKTDSSDSENDEDDDEPKSGQRASVGPQNNDDEMLEDEKPSAKAKRESDADTESAAEDTGQPERASDVLKEDEAKSVSEQEAENNIDEENMERAENGDEILTTKAKGESDVPTQGDPGDSNPDGGDDDENEKAEPAMSVGAKSKSGLGESGDGEDEPSPENAAVDQSAEEEAEDPNVSEGDGEDAKKVKKVVNKEGRVMEQEDDQDVDEDAEDDDEERERKENERKEEAGMSEEEAEEEDKAKKEEPVSKNPSQSEREAAAADDEGASGKRVDPETGESDGEVSEDDVEGMDVAESNEEDKANMDKGNGSLESPDTDRNLGDGEGANDDD